MLSAAKQLAPPDAEILRFAQHDTCQELSAIYLVILAAQHPTPHQFNRVAVAPIPFVDADHIVITEFRKRLVSLRLPKALRLAYTPGGSSRRSSTA